MNVIKLKRENNALDIALMVESATRTERQEYDETTIVEALVREAGCDRTLAKEVAGTYEVEDAWGNKHDIRDIDIIFTTNMLKLWNAYDRRESSRTK